MKITLAMYNHKTHAVDLVEIPSRHGGFTSEQLEIEVDIAKKRFPDKDWSYMGALWCNNGYPQWYMEK